MSKGKLFVISGASGVGKSTVLGRVMTAIDDLRFSVSATTRKPRPGEVEGESYYFVTKEQFRQMIEENAFLEYDAHMDNYYGTPEAQLEEKLGLGKGSVGLLPLNETALGVENAYQIASACSRVKAIFLGGEDLTADLRCKRTKEGHEIAYARSRMVVAARAAGVDVYDTPFTDVNDDEGIYVDAQYAKSLGFTGKSAISPRHVKAINQVFSPTKTDIDYAYEVMEAIRIGNEQGKGAVSLRGKMIDAPIVARAQQTIAAAEALGLGREA